MFSTQLAENFFYSGEGYLPEDVKLKRRNLECLMLFVICYPLNLITEDSLASPLQPLIKLRVVVTMIS